MSLLMSDYPNQHSQTQLLSELLAGCLTLGNSTVLAAFFCLTSLRVMNPKSLQNYHHL
jgi:hypothetical protein